MLEIRDLESGYGNLQVLRGVSFDVEAGQSVALLGANGAGKTTLLRAVLGLLPAWRGSIRFMGRDIGSLPTYKRVRRGLAYMSELGVFPNLSVVENLKIGAYLVERQRWKEGLKSTWKLFPDLAARPRVLAANLSGGQRKMLGIARALMGRPSLVVMDEPSAGLSPLFVTQVLEAVARARADGYTFLIAGQNVRFLGELDFGYVMDGGEIVARGSIEDLRREDTVRRAYFGMLGKVRAAENQDTSRPQ